MPSIQRLGRSVILAAAAAMILSCDDDPAGSGGAIQIALDPAALTVTQGNTGTTNLSISRTGGNTEMVTLSVAGLPAGVSASINPSQLVAETVNAVITVGVPATVPAGTSSATITATANGVTKATQALQLTIAPTPDFRLTLASTNLNVTTGGSGNTTVNIERTSFAGAVELALLNPPAGITGVFAPSPTTANVSTVTVNVATTVTPGSYPLIIQGQATGPGERTTQLTVNVAAPPGAFTIGLDPASFSLPRGNSAVVNITLVRTDYAGPINLAFENPAAGITGTIVPSSTTGNSATFTINVGDAVPAGIYQLRIRGTATGFIDRVAFVQLTVTVPIGASVEYLFCDASSVPVFFAYQDGNSAWKTVTPSNQGGITRFAFTLVQARGGILTVSHTTAPMVADALRVRRGTSSRVPTRPATTVRRTARVLPLVDQYLTEVVYASSTELAAAGTANCGETLPTGTVTGTVTGIATGEFGIVSLGGATEVFLGGVSTNPVTFTGVPDRTLDLVGSRMTQGNAPDRVLVLRNLNVADGEPLPSDIDFTGPGSSNPTNATVTISNAGTDLLEIFTEVVTANGHGLLWFDMIPSQSNVRPWSGLSTGAMAPGDFHGLYAFATPLAGVQSDGRVTLRWVGPVADQTVALGPNLPAPTATLVAPGPYPRYRFQGAIPVEYDKGLEIFISNIANPENVYSITATNAWLAGSGSALAYDITMPDVAGLAGFPAAARLLAGPNDAAVNAFGFNGPGVFDLRPTIGTEYKAATRSVILGVPQ